MVAALPYRLGSQPAVFGQLYNDARSTDNLEQETFSDKESMLTIDVSMKDQPQIDI